MTLVSDRQSFRRREELAADLIRALGRLARKNRERAVDCPFNLREAKNGEEYKLLAKARGLWLDGYNERKS